MSSTNTQHNHNETLQLMTYYFNLAYKLHTVNPVLSSYYIKQMRLLSVMNNIVIHNTIKLQYCESCNHIYVPSTLAINTKQIKSSPHRHKKHRYSTRLYYKCLLCTHVTIHKNIIHYNKLLANKKAADSHSKMIPTDRSATHQQLLSQVTNSVTTPKLVLNQHATNNLYYMEQQKSKYTQQLKQVNSIFQSDPNHNTIDNATNKINSVQSNTMKPYTFTAPVIESKTIDNKSVITNTTNLYSLFQSFNK